MFEDSLFASGVQGRNAKRTRWIALTSIGIQAFALTAFLVVPLLWPETLPLVSVAPKLSIVSMRKPEVKIPPKIVRVVTSPDTAVHAPSAAPQVLQARGGGVLTHSPSTVEAASDAPSLYHSGTGMANLGSIGMGALLGPGTGASVVVAAPKKSEPLAISQGVSKGMLLAPIQPIYPRIAIAARIEGTVVVSAIIDKKGRITGLQVVSGPEMLKQAAADAIRDARYRRRGSAAGRTDQAPARYFLNRHD
jgi:protein TonB